MRILILFLAAILMASVQAHEHIDAGAAAPDAGSKLVFNDAEQFFDSADYVWRLEFEYGSYFPSQYGTNQLTFSALPATPFWAGPEDGHAAVGAKLQLQIVRVLGPTGGAFGYWEPNRHTNSASPTAQFQVDSVEPAEGAGLYTFDLTEAFPSDPYGHIHDRAFSANLRGLYFVDIRLRDVSGIHVSSDVKRMIFQATPKRTQTNLSTAQISGLNVTVIYDGAPKPISPVTTPASLQTDVLYGSSLTPPTLPGVYPVRAFINEANYKGSEEGVLTIEKQTQTIDFPAITQEIGAGDTIPLSAVATSNLDVEFTVMSGPGEISAGGTDLLVTDSGDIVVKASQPGDAIYSAAPDVVQTLSTTKQAQTIQWAALGDREFSSAPVILSAVASSGLPISYSASGPVHLAGNVLRFTSTGTVMLTARQNGNAEFSSASSQQQFQILDRTSPTLATKASVKSRSRSITLNAKVADNLGVRQVVYSILAPGSKKGAFKRKSVSSTPGSTLAVRIPVATPKSGTYRVTMEAIDASGKRSAKKTVKIQAKR